jgi:hypothetical protein
MCDFQTQQFINDAVMALTSDKSMFTAFDISLKVKDQQKNNGLAVSRHNQIKNDIHKAASSVLADGSYSRTLHDVGAPSLAYLYHPTGADVNLYVPVDRKDDPVDDSNDGISSLAKSLQVAASAPVDDDDDDDDDDDQDISSVDCFGRLRVTSGVLKAAGFDPGDTVYVSSAQGKITLAKNPSSSDVARYKIDCRRNIRMSKRTLSKSNVDDKQLFSFDSEPQLITIQTKD